MQDTAARCLVISGDSHVGPSVRGDLRPYCEAKHLQDLDDFILMLDGMPAVANEMDLYDTWDPAHLAVSAARSKMEGLTSTDARHSDMDADGVAADVIFHGGLNGEAIPFFGFGIGITGSKVRFDDLEPVGVHIYNRWLADFVASAPERHVGVAHISVRDVDSAVAEVRWAKDHGLDAINLPAPRRDFVPLTDPVWEPLWATCADLEVTMVSHAGGGDLESRVTGQAQNPLYLMEMPWMGRRGIWHLIFSGVFERHPTLHFVLAEQYGDWVPATLKEMDSAYRWAQNGALRRALPKLPSEYFLSSCFVTASFMSREEAELGVEGGYASQLLWGGDYPHPEGTFPHTTLSLRKTMAGLDREVVDAYLCDNIARAYRMDTTKLRELADRIGPTYDDLSRPYDGPRPDDTPTSLAYREFGHYA